MVDELIYLRFECCRRSFVVSQIDGAAVFFSLHTEMRSIGSDAAAEYTVLVLCNTIHRTLQTAASGLQNIAAPRCLCSVLAWPHRPWQFACGRLWVLGDSCRIQDVGNWPQEISKELLLKVDYWGQKGIFPSDEDGARRRRPFFLSVLPRRSWISWSIFFSVLDRLKFSGLPHYAPDVLLHTFSILTRQDDWCRGVRSLVQGVSLLLGSHYYLLSTV